MASVTFIFGVLLAFLTLATGTDVSTRLRVDLKQDHRKTYLVYDGYGQKVLYRVKQSLNKAILADANGTTMSTIKKSVLSLDYNWRIYIGRERNPRYFARRVPKSNRERVHVQIKRDTKKTPFIAFEIRGRYSEHKLCDITSIGPNGTKSIAVKIHQDLVLSNDVFIVDILATVAPELAMAMVNLLQQMY